MNDNMDYRSVDVPTIQDSLDMDTIHTGKQELNSNDRNMQKKIMNEKKSKIIKSYNQIQSKLGVHSPYKFPDAIKNF